MPSDRLEFVKQLALDAGYLSLQGYGRCEAIPKAGKDEYDILTEYDPLLESMIRERIAARFPDEPILGEEHGIEDTSADLRSRLWIVDPIDGTLNYQRGIPLYGVSIAYCEQCMPGCAAIFLPALNQLFYAAHGQGAFLESPGGGPAERIHASSETDVMKMAISLEGKELYKLLRACEREGIPRRSLRVSLCAVYSLAYVATGRLNIFYNTALSLWDCAAGDLILREAGAPGLTDLHGASIFPGYVERFIEGQTRSFPIIAVSTQSMLEEPLRRILESAGLTGA